MARPRKWKLYCDPVELHNELLERTRTGITTNKLGQMYLDIVAGIKSRPNFSGYYGELIDDMTFLAIHNLVKYTHNYNPDYFLTNPNAAFTYCSRIVFQCFTMTITANKKKSEKEKMYLEALTEKLIREQEEDIANQNFIKEI